MKKIDKIIDILIMGCWILLLILDIFVGKNAGLAVRDLIIIEMFVFVLFAKRALLRQREISEQIQGMYQNGLDFLQKKLDEQINKPKRKRGRPRKNER